MSSPESREMKPKPFEVLNHFTVPVSRLPLSWLPPRAVGALAARTGLPGFRLPASCRAVASTRLSREDDRRLVGDGRQQQDQCLQDDAQDQQGGCAGGQVGCDDCSTGRRAG